MPKYLSTCVTRYDRATGIQFFRVISENGINKFQPSWRDLHRSEENGLKCDSPISSVLQLPPNGTQNFLR